ncbi:MAG: glycoside hydrolase family 88 protein [Eubacteriales bacterium]|nr:glycoside hydrolase family 88 protein [Eubacteriales bacterium]
MALFVHKKQPLPPPLSVFQAKAALAEAIQQVTVNLTRYREHCQSHSSVGGIYPICDNVQWTCGFWPGEVWLSYEKTGSVAFRDVGLHFVDSFFTRIQRGKEGKPHALGLLYMPSCVATYRLTGSEKAKKAALLAADYLCKRYRPEGRYLQALGSMGTPGEGRILVDSLLSLPLLHWAYAITGEARYDLVARAHGDTCLKYLFRQNGSVCDTFYFHDDGTPDHGECHYGYSDDSFWARGQAWAMYGAALCYQATGLQEYLLAFEKATQFYLQHLPTDGVPYWDLLFQSGQEEPRDSSAAAIAICGLLTAAELVSDTAGEAYKETALRMLSSLKNYYAVPIHYPGFGQLAHGTNSRKSPYNHCAHEGVDECTSWGDYFYMEALSRACGSWQPYWCGQ